MAKRGETVSDAAFLLACITLTVVDNLGPDTPFWYVLGLMVPSFALGVSAEWSRRCRRDRS